MHPNSTQKMPIDAYRTIATPATGEFKDRGSKFIGYAFPVDEEAQALAHIEALRKEHFKANHHCFAWRIGTDGTRFRASDDGEPSGTAGRPILGQIDAAGLTNLLVVVVRYFGGTLLGASGLINAYRETALAALQNSTVKEVVLKGQYVFKVTYSALPDMINAVKKGQIELIEQEFGETDALLTIAIRHSEAEKTLLALKAALWKTSTDEALTLDWPDGVEKIET
jgi:uncharacterized YigZ family protein